MSIVDQSAVHRTQYIAAIYDVLPAIVSYSNLEQLVALERCNWRVYGMVRLFRPIAYKSKQVLAASGYDIRVAFLWKAMFMNVNRFNDMVCDFAKFVILNKDIWCISNGLIHNKETKTFMTEITIRRSMYYTTWCPFYVTERGLCKIRFSLRYKVSKECYRKHLVSGTTLIYVFDEIIRSEEPSIPKHQLYIFAESRTNLIQETIRLMNELVKYNIMKDHLEMSQRTSEHAFCLSS